MQRSILRHGFRGLGRLPHVGSHPGIPLATGLTLITGIAGIERGGALGFVLGICFGAAVYGTFLFIGAVDRSRTSDRLSAREIKEYGAIP